MKTKINKVDLHDIDLFKQEVGDIEHIPYDKIHPITHIAKPTTQYKPQHIEHINNTFSTEFEPDTIGSEEALSFRRSGIQKRLFSRLRNGHLSIEAELDLHGMTIPLAHDALARFLQECQQFKLRCVRIIHGKGWGSKHHKPVLKTKLNTWLQQDESILAFCSAPIEDGGTGAVYVLLKRLK